MTERGRSSLRRDAATLGIGPSALEWDGSTLTIRVDEVAAPWPWRVRGTVRVRPEALSVETMTLDRAGRHRWTPAAPCASLEVAFAEPAIRWSGQAYFDINAGDEPLESGFRHWAWSRAITPDGTAILYDIARRDDAEPLSIALHIDRKGQAREIDRPALAPLPRTLWRMERVTRCEPGYSPSVLRTFEDAPFYSRSLVASRLMGHPVTAIHESLSLDRFRSPWVKALLPFRMPRFER